MLLATTCVLVKHSMKREAVGADEVDIEIHQLRSLWLN